MRAGLTTVPAETAPSPQLTCAAYAPAAHGGASLKVAMRMSPVSSPSRAENGLALYATIAASAEAGTAARATAATAREQMRRDMGSSPPGEIAAARAPERLLGLLGGALGVHEAAVAGDARLGGRDPRVAAAQQLGLHELAVRARDVGQDAA